MRHILFIFMLMMLTGAAFAQQGNTLTLTGAGAPTGNCSFMFLYNDSTNADEYNCFNGAWNKITSAGSSVSSVFTRTGAVVATSGDYTAAQVTNAVALNAANTFTSAGTLDLTASTVANAFRVPSVAGGTSGANGAIVYDSTNGVTRIRTAGADSIAAATTATSTTTTVVLHATATSGIYTPSAIVAADLPSAVYNNAANSGTSAMTLDMSASNGNTAFRLPVKANAAPASQGGLGYDSTAGRIVAFRNGFNSAPTATVITQTDTITGADYTNATTTPSTVFSFTLPATTAAAAYKYDCSMLWESTAATLVGPVFGVNLSAAPTQLTANAAVQNTLAGADVNGYLSNTTTGSQTLVTSSAAGVTSTNYWAKIWGTIEGAATAGSTFIINAASTSATTALLNIRRGGICTLTWE